MNKSVSAAAICVMFVFVLALAIAQGVSADTKTLGPGGTFSETVHASQLDFVNWTWSTSPSTDVQFVVTQPDGTEIRNITANSETYFTIAGSAGTYTMTWNNLGSSSVVLTYDVGTFSGGFQPVEHALDLFVIMLAVGAIAVVVIIVLVVFVSMKGDKKTAKQTVYGPQGQHAPPGESPAPFIPGMCPKCGSHIDSQHVFCPKCGARVR
jgi:hypothetical protein